MSSNVKSLGFDPKFIDMPSEEELESMMLESALDDHILEISKKIVYLKQLPTSSRVEIAILRLDEATVLLREEYSIRFPDIEKE